MMPNSSLVSSFNNNDGMQRIGYMLACTNLD
jgi:hypothetical protein